MVSVIFIFTFDGRNHKTFDSGSQCLIFVSVYPTILSSLYCIVSIYLPIYLCLPTPQSTYPFTYLSVYIPLCVLTSLSTCLSVYLLLCIPASVYLSLYLPVSLSTCFSVYLPLCLPVSLSLCLSVSLSPCLSVSRCLEDF